MTETRNNILNIIIIFTIVSFLFFQKIFSFFLNMSFVNYFDEILIVLFFGIVVIQIIFQKTIQRDHLTILSAFFFLILISQIHPNATLPKIILQSAIHLKLFFFFYLFRYIYKTKEKIIKNILQALLLLTLAGLFVSFFLQSSFTTFFDIKPVFRYGFVRASGFQLEVNHVAVTLSLYYLYFVLFRNTQNHFNKFLTGTILFIILTFLTGSRTVLVAIPLAFFFIYKNKTNFYLKYFLMVLSLAAIITGYNYLQNTELYKITIQNMTDTIEAEDSSYIRGIMIYYGVNLAIENFPVGTGAASFGTVLSEGSPVYSKLGLDKMDFFIDMSGIFDSNLASILGEFGFTGLMLFIFLFLHIYRTDICRRNYLINNNQKAFYKSIILLIVIYSAAMGTMMNSYSAALFALFLNLSPEKETTDKLS